MIMVLASIIAVCGAIPVLADISYTKEIGRYLLPSVSGQDFIRVTGLTPSQRVGKTIKSSNESVAYAFLNGGYGHSGENGKYEYFSNKAPQNMFSRTATIVVFYKKPGTATVSFKINGKTYKIKVKGYKYVNPLKSLTITGYNNGKTLHKKFNNDYKVYEKLKNSLKNAKITIKPKSGWKIASVDVHDDKGSLWIAPIKDEDAKKYSKLYSSLSVNGINSKNYFWLRINLVNKNGGQVEVEYNLSKY